MKTYEVEVGFVPNPEMLQFVERLDELLKDPKTLNRVLAVAAADTIVTAIRERFMAGLPEALKMHLADRPPPTAASVDRQLEKQLRDAMSGLTKARAAGVPSKIDLAERRVRRLFDSYQRQLTGNAQRRGGRRSNYARLVSRAMQVFSEMTAMTGLTGDSTARTVGIGNLEQLEQIETPTANRSGRTTSPMRTLWRHLEYGTGVFASYPQVNAGSHYKSSKLPGAWWWGPRASRRRGVLVAGSTPVAALRLGSDFYDTKEAKEFGQRVKELLTQALAG